MDMLSGVLSASFSPSYTQYITSCTLQTLRYQEPETLQRSLHSLLVSLQSISRNSHRCTIQSASKHSTLAEEFCALTSTSLNLQDIIPRVDTETLRFSDAYSKTSDNELLQTRRHSLLLLRNVGRLVDVLGFPTLLSSAISTSPPNASSALELNSHIRRLHASCSGSVLLTSVSRQSDNVMLSLTNDLINMLQTSGLKLAAAMRAVGCLARFLPDLCPFLSNTCSRDRVLAILFLNCRLVALKGTLDALQPLRRLAEAERWNQYQPGSTHSWSIGQQTERYLKRYTEMFREQSFSIISMTRSLFYQTAQLQHRPDTLLDPLRPLPDTLAVFPPCLVEVLLTTLNEFIPIIQDDAARDAILTQALYCSGSMGRLGVNFNMLLLATTKGFDGWNDMEWATVIQKHRYLAGRLDTLLDSGAAPAT